MSSWEKRPEWGEFAVAPVWIPEGTSSTVLSWDQLWTSYLFQIRPIPPIPWPWRPCFSTCHNHAASLRDFSKQRDSQILQPRNARSQASWHGPVPPRQCFKKTQLVGGSINLTTYESQFGSSASQIVIRISMHIGRKNDCILYLYIYTPSYTPRSNMWLDTCFLTTRNHHFSNCSPTRVKFRLCVLRSHSAWVRAPFGAFPYRIWWGAAIGAWVHRRRCGDLECWGWPGQLLRLLPHKGIQM